MIVGYINENGCLTARAVEEVCQFTRDAKGLLVKQKITVEEQVALLSRSGWKPVDEIDEAMIAGTEEGVVLRPVPYDAGDHIAYTYERAIDTQFFQTRIDALKAELAAGDYKVVKNQEASLAGVALPYEPVALHAERQALRDQIEAIEAERDAIVL